MDPCTLAAAITAFGQCAVAIAKISHGAYRIYRNTASARKDSQRFFNNVHLFGASMTAAHKALRDHFLKFPNSSLLETFSNKGMIHAAMFDAKCIKKDVKAIIHSIKSSQKTMPIIHRIKWIFRVKTVRELYCQMERAKASVGFLMQLLNLEMLQNLILRGIPPQQARLFENLPQEIELLKVEMRDQTCLIETLQSKVRRLEQSNSQSEGRASEIDNLLEVGKQKLREAPSLPISPPASPMDSNPPPSDEVVHSQGSTSMNIPNLERSMIIRTAEPPTTSQSRAAVPRLRRMQRRQGFPIRSEDENYHGDYDSGSRTSDSSPPAENHITRMDSSELEAGPSRDREYQAIRPIRYLLDLDPSHKIQSIQGLINDRPVTAHLDQDFEGNLISLAFAKNLDLEVDLHETGSGEIFVYFHGDNREPERSIGRVSFVWTTGSSLNHSFRVHCDVLGYDLRPILFGQAFLEKLENYSKIDGRDGRHIAELQGKMRRHAQDTSSSSSDPSMETS